MRAWLGAAAGIQKVAQRALYRDPNTPPESFGFHLSTTQSKTRVGEITNAFFTGYNVALSGACPNVIRGACEELPDVVRPFAFEGTGMGYAARGLFDTRSDPGGLGPFGDSLHPGYRFLYYIGFGIWTGFLGAWKTNRAARALTDPKYAGLLYDGYGFKQGFFHRPRRPQTHRKLMNLPEPVRPDAYRGYGRSLWFVFRDDPRGLADEIESLPDLARPATLTGIGLAILFTSPDDLVGVVQKLQTLPSAWQRDLERGMRLALFVRQEAQPEALRLWLEALPSPHATRLESHLAHAVHAYRSTYRNPGFLTAFTRAC